MSKQNLSSEPVSGIQPAVLRWARQSIGLSVMEVAAKLKRPVEEVEAWESGEKAPTYPQLEKLAYQVCKRPLAVFFLPAPPEEIPPAKEFRTLPDTDLNSLVADTYLKIRRAHAYQLALQELFDGRNPTQRRIWRELRLSDEGPLEQQAQGIREFLGVSLDTQIAWKDDDTALKQWRMAVERVGIFIFKAAFKQKEISGFCLLDEEFPVIYLNNSTTKTRQIFSLFHELAHLLFSVNGLSKLDKSYIEQLPKPEREIEKYCNAIAAEILIPAADFERETRAWSLDVECFDEDRFSYLANRYGVSREAILRCFLDRGRVSQAFYEKQAGYWASQKKSSSGGDWYASQNAYLSEHFAKEVISRHYRNQLSVEQAADLLGISPKNFPGLEQRILQGTAV